MEMSGAAHTRLCSEAKQLRLGYDANAVYIQHSGPPAKPRRYSAAGEVAKIWLGQGSASRRQALGGEKKKAKLKKTASELERASTGSRRKTGWRKRRKTTKIKKYYGIIMIW